MIDCFHSTIVLNSTIWAIRTTKPTNQEDHRNKATEFEFCVVNDTWSQ